MTSSIIVECLIFLFFFYIASNPATCSIYEVDLRALMSFKENIMDPRGALDSWRYNETLNYCTWKGISCGSRHRTRVVSIDLNSQGLVGCLSPHLGLLPYTIANLSTHLSLLAMSSNLIHGTIPSAIGDLTGLSTFVLEYNLFSGPIPLSIGGLTKLQEIYLSANKFTGKLPSSLGNLTLLNTLCIEINNISGSIPPSLALDFSKNRLSGLVPSTIGSCLSLQQLFLSGNSFHGEIPQELSLLKGLQELDLSSNNFSGRIPSFLGELSLAKLNLSFNKLRGPVPVEGVFRNVSAILLEGNTELCGGISELKLPPCPPMNPKKKNSHIPLKIIVPVSVSGAIFIAIVAFSYTFIRHKTKSRDDLYASPFESQFPRLSYADLLRATDGFSAANMIGSGRFGSVYKGIINDGNLTVAVKVLNLHVQGAHKSFTRECTVLRSGNGSLDKWLHLDTDGQDENIWYLTLMQRLNIAIDVASALEYLHNGTDSAVVHGDLKPSNILLDDVMTAHVGDFGLAKLISNVSSGYATHESHSVAVKGTIGYIAPEYRMAGIVSTHGDIYSYGILLLELFTNIKPTSDVLSDNASLHNFVAANLELDHAMDIVDPLVLQKERHMIIVVLGAMWLLY
ncbi:UNVERIFIED_CONTAM: putative LRR receptor-like serine/threonine-protein kinase [Sesamum calycinum]|uniref:non-specific serine/threonine protein kinase n=1 Tax=Sesamum calycinum TaxID=2727403 RepID=A0AAW2NFB3_9LAMI